MIDDGRLMIAGKQNNFEFIENENLLPAECLLRLHGESHELASIFTKTRKTAQSKGS
jgi:hypothetical protein